MSGPAAHSSSASGRGRLALPLSRRGASRTFSLSYLVRNTIMNLTTQDEQVACFANAATHLAAGGCFVMEVVVPDLQRLPPGDTVRAFRVTPTHLGFEEYDVATQASFSHHYWLTDGALETFSARSATCGRPSSTSWLGWPS